MNENENVTNLNEAGGDQYRAQRIENMEKLEALGYEPFGFAYERTGLLSEVRAMWEAALQSSELGVRSSESNAHEISSGRAEGVQGDDSKLQTSNSQLQDNSELRTPNSELPEAAPQIRVKIAGRLLGIRKMGKTIFADLRDGTDHIQLFINAKNCGDDSFAAVKLLDYGDIIGAEGELFVTRTGELSVRMEKWVLLSKALRQPPEKFHGLQDQEDRYRYRYIDLFSNQESRERFNKRIAIFRETRRWLEDRGFMEVETPILQPHAGGATAKPFITHYNALNCEMFMRIAPELYLKRLIIGGFDKVFELGRDFRNEGLDRTHNPEFTVLEIYQAYGDRTAMKNIIEGLIPHLCDTVIGSRKIQYGDGEIDFTPPYREVAYSDLVREKMGDDWFDLDVETARAKARELGLDITNEMNHLLITHEIYDKTIEKTLFQPTFVTRVPHEFVPLAKVCRDDPTKADVFEFVVAGKELCPGYTEQNNPFAQREAFQAQVDEDAESTDEDFVEALEYAMPPTGGMGLGMDRIVMMLTGTDVIRDVILFPQLKTKA